MVVSVFALGTVRCRKDAQYRNLSSHEKLGINFISHSTSHWSLQDYIDFRLRSSDYFFPRFVRVMKTERYPLSEFWSFFVQLPEENALYT